MIRILFFLALIFLLGIGFAWLAERPGDLTATFGGLQYEVTLLSAAVLLVAVFAALMILWWIIRGLWRSPYTVSRYFRVRRRDRGYQALSTGLIAAGAGDAGMARRMGKQAAKLISSDQEPMINLLDAQASLLEGDHAAARVKYEALAKDPETRLLGLRGLYLEAERMGERNVARHYAAEAVAIAPQLGWAATAALEAKTMHRDWQGALALVDAQKSASGIDRTLTTRRRAVLLTASAMEQFDADPAAAKASATEASRLQPEFIPAALVLARASIRLDDLRKAVKVLETTWKLAPHPEVADIYIHLRHGDSTLDRLERARRLRKLKANNVESELAVARAALDAGEFKEARAAAEAAVRIAPREGAYLLLADIEEAETGDQGRIRHWLAQAVRAPQDPAWVADGIVSDHWQPVSPVTGELDAFQWRAPMERLGQVLEGEASLQTLPMLKLDAAPAKPLEEEPKPVIATEKGPPAREVVKPTFVDDLVEDDTERQLFRPPSPDDPGLDPDDDLVDDHAPKGLRLF